ncbi:MAG: cupin domain-containing protein [Chloroflexi bacterium]|jgi:quercetin dioxygenase-like cupin family protein|nr:cupin domain-containing protein [Chloroflexota bacterium]
MSHPDPNGPAATRPWRAGDELWNPVTRERAVILETPLDNPVGRARAEMTALVGSRVLGEHLHPGLVERFTVLEGQLTVRLDEKTWKLREGETAEVRAGQWHDWWNAEDHDARVIVEVEPGARFAHMLETLFGLAEMGHVDAKGMPNLLQMALVGREFSDTVQFRSPPPVMQKVLFAAIAPLAHALGYRATYPQLSRSLLRPEEPESTPAVGTPPAAGG